MTKISATRRLLLLALLFLPVVAGIEISHPNTDYISPLANNIPVDPNDGLVPVLRRPGITPEFAHDQMRMSLLSVALLRQPIAKKDLLLYGCEMGAT
mgnify:CR=1 FL=1